MSEGLSVEERRYRQAHNKGMTMSQYKDWVRTQAKKEDSKNLPFTFSKPPRRRGRMWAVPCEKCGAALTINKTTFIAVCPACGTFNRFETDEDRERTDIMTTEDPLGDDNEQ